MIISIYQVCYTCYVLLVPSSYYQQLFTLDLHWFVRMERWNPYFKDLYDPLMAGSIDGTDEVPHDHGIIRAMEAKYKPNKSVIGDTTCTIFVGRLNFGTTEDTLREEFNKYGHIKKIRLIRDLVTGYSKGFAFIEYVDPAEAEKAQVSANRLEIDDKEIIVELECERSLKGWIPRRLGGGLGGRKGSGQLRFGGIDRPFRKPIIVNKNAQGRDSYSSSYLNNPGSSDSYNSRSRKEQPRYSRPKEKQQYHSNRSSRSNKR